MPRTPFPRSYWVFQPMLLAGYYPGDRDPGGTRERMRALLDCGVRTVVNLMEPDERDLEGRPFTPYEPVFLELGSERGVETTCERFPVRDLGIPSRRTMGVILDTIYESIRAGRPVYVHCWGGVGRTGTVVGCYLLRHHLAGSDDVLDHIARLRVADPSSHRPSPETPEQRRFVLGWPDVDERS